MGTESLELLCAELERLYPLDELKSLSRDILGLEPEVVGGDTAAGSFARALATYCERNDALEALCDALFVGRADLDPAVADMRKRSSSGAEILLNGDSFGEYLITSQLGGGRLGTVYGARRGGTDVRLKVLHPEATLDRRGLHRFLTANRLLATVDAEAIPTGIEAGEIEGRPYVAHDLVEGETLGERLRRAGPAQVGDSIVILRGILDGLEELHRHRLVHGNLQAENVIVIERADTVIGVSLVDAGANHLRVLTSNASGASSSLSSLGAPRASSPEQIEGGLADARSDLYCFGALLFEALAGKPVFTGRNEMESLIGHLVREPAPLATAAPRGWVSHELDDIVARLLEKDPAARPREASEVTEILQRVSDAGPARESVISDEEVQLRINDLLANPYDDAPMDMLEVAVDEGADAERVTQAFEWVASQLAPPDNPTVQRSQARMLYRAGKLHEKARQDKVQAESLYQQAVNIDPTDTDATAALERLRRQLGKYDEIVEMLLERSERAESPKARARELAAIGKLYASELEDPEQALVAFTSAFCEDPEAKDYGREVERLAGKNQQAWEEVLSSCVETGSTELAPAPRNALLVQMGRWYLDRVGRADLALPCLQAVVAADSVHAEALEVMSTLYRKAQQWRELGMVLSARADAPNTTPASARDLRAEAAELLELHLGDPAAAKALYERVLGEDPTHPKANEALGKLYERQGDLEGFVKILEQRAASLSGEARLGVLCKRAEVFEVQLDNITEATQQFETVVAEDPRHVDALKGLDRIYSRVGRYPDLIGVLEKQVAAAVTPRQKITLHERIAGIYDEEFIDHEKAAEAWEKILELEPNRDAALAEAARHYSRIERWDDVVILTERRLDAATDDPQRISIGLSLGGVLADKLGVEERAIEAYENVLGIDAGNAHALEALALLRASAGDADRALEAIDKLATEATEPAAKSQHYLRAAELLTQRGEADGAIDRLKLAVDASPDNRDLTARLRTAYTQRGDAKSAVELLERELDRTEAGGLRAKLSGELARLLLFYLEDDKRAEAAAKKSVDDDPTNLDALTVLGDVAYAGSRYLEAAKYYEQVAGRIDALEKHERVRVLDAYVDSLAQQNEKSKAIAWTDKLLRLDPEDRTVLARASSVYFDHGPPRRAFELLWDFWHRFREELDTGEAAVARYKLGEAARRTGDLEGALEHLESAVELDPDSPLPLRALSQVFEARNEWEEVVRVKFRELETVIGDERHTLLIDLGDLAAEKLKDPSYAAKSYLTALSERPSDRKIMMKLMQLYSAEKDWSKLVKVILKLAGFVDDPQQKAKYLHTAAQVAHKEMHDRDQAAELYDRVFEADPRLAGVVEEALALNRARGDYERIKALLKEKITTASEADDKPAMIATMDELAGVYLRNFNRVDQAVAVSEAALELDPDNEERKAQLAGLYAKEPATYFDRSVRLYYELLKGDPYRVEIYKALRKLYTEVKRPDAAWCICQALYAMNQSDPDEAMFFKRMHTGAPAAPRDRVTDRDWLELVMHPDADTALTVLFAIIQPTIIAERGKSLESFGYVEEHQLFPDTDPYMMVQSLNYASDILEMDCPPLYQNTNDPGGLSFVHAHTPAIVLGNAALDVADMTQEVAFVAAHQLAYFRPGMYVRHLVPTGTGLKAWLFAGISIAVPNFPIPATLQGEVASARTALQKRLGPQQREHVTRAATKLMEKGAALDLKRWVAAVDLTADRVGLIFSDDLQTTVKLIRATDGHLSSLPAQDRLREIHSYAISPEYVTLRSRLGLGVDQ